MICSPFSASKRVRLSEIGAEPGQPERLRVLRPGEIRKGQ